MGLHEVLPANKLSSLVEKNALKLHWFLSHGYVPHYYQLVFHTILDNNRLCRFRHIVAGRRGGKTLAGAEEILFYSLHPSQFHRDLHEVDRNNPLWIWCLARDYKLGRPALLKFREVLRNVGLTHGVDYKEHRTERYFEFANGTLVEFKSADDPESLRGAGLDLIWIDEAAVIPNEDAWTVVYPSLADRLGGAIFTTTPSGKNWYYDEFFSEEALRSSDSYRVEFRSIDNPHFKREEWERFRRIYHPLLFKQEFEASFDALSGVELSGDWLHYYTMSDLIQDVGRENGRLNLKMYMGVDPAISLSDKADRFAMAVVGISPDNINGYLIDLYADRIPFPEQVNMIQEWFHKYRPLLIGVESQAYQAALAQQAMRIPGLPPILPIMSSGKKSQRILSMAPLFKIAKIKIRKEHYDFIDEWVNYDSSLRSTKDDCLDAVEIALRTAGALLPADSFSESRKKMSTWEDIARREAEMIANKEHSDEFLGSWF